MAYSETDLRSIIRELCEREGRAATATKLKVKPNYVSMLLSKDKPRPITPAIAKSLGFRMETSTNKVFVPVEALNQVVLDR